MTKKKHPQDRAERLKINEIKKRKRNRKQKDVERVSEGPSDTVLSDE